MTTVTYSLAETEGVRKMFLFNLTYVKPLEEIEALLPAHIAFLDEFYARGTFLCSGRKAPPHRRRDSV